MEVVVDLLWSSAARTVLYFAVLDFGALVYSVADFLPIYIIQVPVIFIYLGAEVLQAVLTHSCLTTL